MSLMTGAIVARESGAWRTAQEAGIGTGTTLRHENETTTVSTTLTTLTTTLFHTGASVSGSVAHSTTAKVASASISAAKAALDAEEIAYKIKIASSVAFVAGLAQVHHHHRGRHLHRHCCCHRLVGFVVFVLITAFL